MVWHIHRDSKLELPLDKQGLPGTWVAVQCPVPSGLAPIVLTETGEITKTFEHLCFADFWWHGGKHYQRSAETNTTFVIFRRSCGKKTNVATLCFCLLCLPMPHTK